MAASHVKILWQSHVIESAASYVELCCVTRWSLLCYTLDCVASHVGLGGLLVGGRGGNSSDLGLLVLGVDSDEGAVLVERTRLITVVGRPKRFIVALRNWDIVKVYGGRLLLRVVVVVTGENKSKSTLKFSIVLNSRRETLHIFIVS